MRTFLMARNDGALGVDCENETQLRPLLVEDHEKLLDMLAAHPRMKKMYREVTPVHGNGHVPCAPWENLTVLSPENITVSPLFTQNQSTDIARTPLGEHTVQKFRTAGIPFIETFDLLVPRWQEHASLYDCIHWSIPGVFPFIYEREIFNMCA